MALSDLAVYSEYAYSAMTEVLDQQIALFNGASEGTIMLRPAAHQGDFSDEAFFQKIVGGTVRRRNAYGSGAITSKNLKQIVDRSVKVAAGTPEIRLDPGQFRWIQMNPEVAGAAMGQQLAVDSMADMLNTSIGACVAALSGVPANVNDISAATAPADQVPSFVSLTQTAGKIGDRSAAIRAWVMHSTPMTTLWVNALTNSERLFNYGSVNVIRDPFGRLFVVSDSPNLIATGSKYNTLGLQTGAIYVGANNDFDAMEQGRTGDENLIRTYQAEWSYNVGVQGFSWDTAAGGKSPTDAALFATANWDKYSTSNKDIAGVMLVSK